MQKRDAVPTFFPMRASFPLLALLPFPALPLLAEVSFEKEILPVLNAKCLDCHRAEFEKDGRTVKPKGGLRLDAAWAIQRGGESGPAVVAAKPNNSPLLQRVSLPPDDEDHMPPRGKAEPLTPAETKALRTWIREGAVFGEWVGNEDGKPEPEPEDAALAPPPASERDQLYERLSAGLDPLPEKEWKAVETAGGRIVRLSPSSSLLAIDFRLSEEPATDEQILAALPLASHIAHLDLSRSAATGAALDLAAKSPRLVRLDLGNTGIDDEALAAIKGLAELRHLNLHRSAVGDAGLRVLESLPSLEAVYLWQSNATEAGAARLRKALPYAKIHLK